MKAVLFNLAILGVLYMMASVFNVSFLLPVKDMFDTNNLAGIAMFVGIILAITAFSFVHHCMFGWNGAISNLVIGILLTLFGATAYSYGYGYGLIVASAISLVYVCTYISQYVNIGIGAIATIITVILLVIGISIKDTSKPMKPRELTMDETYIAKYDHNPVKWYFSLYYCDKKDHYSTEDLEITSNYDDMKCAVDMKTKELEAKGCSVYKVLYAPQDS